jgi:hypothetical protein
VLGVAAVVAYFFLRPKEEEMNKVGIIPLAGSREDTIDPEQGEVM